jgi:tetratricopeptide (TPR) repeat protein
MGYLEKEWYKLGLELEKSGDYARAIDSFYKASAIDRLRNLAALPQQVYNRLKSKSPDELKTLANDLDDRLDAICNDGNDQKTLESITAVKDIALGILGELWGMKKTEAG